MEEKATPQEEVKKSPQKSTNYKKLIIILVIVLLLVGGGAWKLLENSPLNPFNAQPQSSLANVAPGDPVVRVNGEEIIRSQVDSMQSQMLAQQGIDPTTLDASMQQQLLTQALNAIVAQTLLNQEIEKANITVTDEDIDTEITRLKEGYESEEAYQEALTTQGVTEDALRTQLNTQLKTQGYLNEKLDIESLTASEEEVNEAYAQLEASGQEDLPTLEEARPQLEQSIIGQKQQELLAKHIQDLRAKADIEILI